MSQIKINLTEKIIKLAKERNITPEQLVINYVAFGLTIDEWTNNDSRLVIEKSKLSSEGESISIGVKQLKKI